MHRVRCTTSDPLRGEQVSAWLDGYHVRQSLERLDSVKPVLALIPEEDGLDAYLRGTDVIDLDASPVPIVHADIVRGAVDLDDEARRIFHFVRDQIRHSWEAGDHKVTLRASEALSAGTGLCYAKSHLAAAMLRRSGTPTGLCFQRLRDAGRLSLHGLIAVHLHGEWRRLDVRGNRPGAQTLCYLIHRPPLRRAARGVSLGSPTPCCCRRW